MLLLTLLVLVFLRLFDAKGCLQYFSPDRHCRLGTIAPLLHHHGYNHSRILKGPVSHKPRGTTR